MLPPTAHTDYYSAEKNPSTYDSLAAFLIGAARGFYWSGPFGWESFDEQDIEQRWLPEFDMRQTHPGGLWEQGYGLLLLFYTTKGKGARAPFHDRISSFFAWAHSAQSLHAVTPHCAAGLRRATKHRKDK